MMATTLCLEMHRETPVIGNIARQGVGFPRLAALPIIYDNSHLAGRLLPSAEYPDVDWTIWAYVMHMRWKKAAINSHRYVYLGRSERSRRPGSRSGASERPLARSLTRTALSTASCHL